MLAFLVIPDENVEEITMSCEMEIEWLTNKMIKIIVLEESFSGLVFKNELRNSRGLNMAKHIRGFLRRKPGQVALENGLTVNMHIKSWEIKHKQTSEKTLKVFE